MTKKLLATFVFLFLFTISLVPVSAEESTESASDKGMKDRNEIMEKRREEVMEKRDELKERKEERQGMVCERIEENIAKKVTRFEENKNRHVANYKTLVDRLTNAISKLDAKGLNTDKLKEDLKELQSMVVAYGEEYVKFIDALKNTQEYACGESEGAFKEALQAAKDQWQVVVDKRQAIMAFYKDVIREDIKELREQAKEDVTNE